MNAVDGGLRRLVVRGDPRARGLAHGEELRDSVRAGVGAWLEQVERRAGCPAGEYLDRFLGSLRFEAAARTWVPGLLEEIVGIAEGARLDPRQVLAYNLDDEEYWWSRESQGLEIFGRETPARCTVLGLREGAADPPLVAQNMDLAGHYSGGQVLLTVEDGGRSCTLLTAAGILGLCGWNSDGVAVCCNSLLDLPHSAAGVPQTLVVRGILRHASAATAAVWLRRVPHASGQNYLLGDPEGLVDLECSSAGVREYGAGQARLAHTNHPLVGSAQGFTDTSGSLDRQAFAERAVEGAEDAADLERILADRTTPICKLAGRPSDAMTFAAMVVELSRPPAARVCPGPPCSQPFREVATRPARDAAGSGRR